MTRNGTAPSPDVLTTYQIARRLGVAQRTVCGWIDAGDLPGTRAPGSCGRRRVRAADLADFARERGIEVSPGGRPLTTDQAARLLGISGKTVAKWCDSGKLRSWRLPGQGARARPRRIPPAAMAEFALRHGIDLPPCAPPAGVLVASPNGWGAGALMDEIAPEPLEQVESWAALGHALGCRPRRAVLIDFALGCRVDALASIRLAASLAPRPLVLALLPEDGDRDEALAAGADAALVRPFGAGEVAGALGGGNHA